MRLLPSNLITLPLSIDSHHTQSKTQQYRWSGSDVCGWCPENQPSEIMRLSSSDLIVSATLRRPSPHLISNTTVSVMKEWDILLTRWKSTKWVHAYAFIWSERLYHSRQTFTTLRLSLNKISTEGVKCLAEALKMNRVSSCIRSHLISSSLAFSVGPHHTWSSMEQYPWWRSEKSSGCPKKQPSKFVRLLSYDLITSATLRIEPHHTWSWRQQNQWRRNETSGGGAENQPSEFRHMLPSDRIASGVFRRPSLHFI